MNSWVKIRDFCCLISQWISILGEEQREQFFPGFFQDFLSVFCFKNRALGKKLWPTWFWQILTKFEVFLKILSPTKDTEKFPNEIS